MMHGQKNIMLIEYLCTEAEMSVGPQLFSNAPLSGRAVSVPAKGKRRSDVTHSSPPRLHLTEKTD